jgi:regulator of sirC expression with transglutaminase-like and TPR domain
MMAVDPIAEIGCQDDAEIVLDTAAIALAAADRAGPDGAAADRGRADFARGVGRLAALAGRLPTTLGGAAARGEALSALLADGEGFAGDTTDYDRPDNADFLAMLSRRRGLPVTLSILYAGLARRVGWQADVVGLPGHVIVALGHDGDRAFIDPFNGGRPLSGGEVAAIAARALGRTIRLEPVHVAPLANRDVLVRLLMNQATRARQAGDRPRALILFARLTLIAPANPGLWWERARLEQLAGDRAAARRSLAAMRETTRDPVLTQRIRAAVDALAR